MTTLSAAVLLFLVMDPVGNVPVFLSVLSGVPRHRTRPILLRELLIALAALITFLFAGRFILATVQVSEPALSVAGGVILFLIALQMVFADIGKIFGQNPDGEPLVVPLAIPLIAGPSAMTTVLILMAREPHNWPNWLAALVGAWLVTGLILFSADFLSRTLGSRGITAIQRLMGMILTTVAVQMFLTGIRQFFELR